MLAVASSIVAVIMATFVMFIRMRSAKKPASAKKIILPPIFMSTGALMFIDERFRVSPVEIIEAIIGGALFSILLIKTSKFEIRDGQIFMKRSKAFPFILVGLLLIRLVLKSFLSSRIDVLELSGMFWLLAFCMIVPWRISMYWSFKNVEKQLKGTK